MAAHVLVSSQPRRFPAGRTCPAPTRKPVTIFAGPGLTMGIDCTDTKMVKISLKELNVQEE